MKQRPNSAHLKQTDRQANMLQQRAGRNPFATGGSTKRLYEVGRVGFNTVVDQVLMKKHARMMSSCDETIDQKAIKRFKNACGDTVPAEVSGSVVPQEPLFVCMGHNAGGAKASFDSTGRPLSNCKSCLVSSSLNHLQCSTKSRLEIIKTNYINEAFIQANNNSVAAALIRADSMGPQPPGQGDNPARGTPFMPRGQNRPGMKFMEDLAIYRDLAPTFVGFASGSYDAPPAMELVKKPPHLAGNCGGLMTVQAAGFDHKRNDESTRDAKRGIEIGQRLCVTYPREDWANKQCGVPHNKMTMVVCNADKAQAEHRLNYDMIRQDEMNSLFNPISFIDHADQFKDVNFMFDSYMTRPLEIGQCRSGCREEGQMIDLKYDLAAPNIQDLIAFALGGLA